MQSTAARIEEAKQHVFFHHKGADGYITIAKKDYNSGKFIQRNYKPERLAEALSGWMGENIFFSQNTFYKPQRKIENIRQLRSLYVDLDFYIFNYEPSWVLAKLEHEYYGKSVPEPNLIIFSGQGVVLIWLIEPVPSKALPLWQAVQNHLLKQLSDLGGDPRSNEAARVFRIAGSVSTKTGDYIPVHVQYRSEHLYNLRDLQFDYLPELVPKEKSKKKRGRKKKVIELFNIHSLNHKRILDIVKLVEMREYDVEGYRETICFLYRYWLCCFMDDTEAALQHTLELNASFLNPLKDSEVKTATKSAEKAYRARSNAEANRVAMEKGYPGAGYNISNAKLIKWLDITPDEMRELSTIINLKEKRRRSYEQVLAKRRENGVKERSVYLQKEKEKTENSLQVIKDILQEFPNLSIRKLAEVSGFSKTHVARLKKLL